MHMRTLYDVCLTDKRVLLRLELNVPLKSGKISELIRIREALATIRYILSKKPRQVIIISHLGRPEGKWDIKYSMSIVAKALEHLLRIRVMFVKDDLISLKTLPKDKIILLENLRFYLGEESNDNRFAKKLASFADIFVNDAFGVMHRKHASVHAVTKYLPSCAGLLVDKEVRALSLLFSPKHPFVVMLGGGKADKLNMIKKMSEQADYVLVAGVGANMILKAKGFSVGNSIVDARKSGDAKKLAKIKNIILPLDVVVAPTVNSRSVKTVPISNIPKDHMIVDIGNKTQKLFRIYIKKARTIFWNGPVGCFEKNQARSGTQMMFSAVAKNKGIKILGGGDMVYALKLCGVSKKRFSYISTGGGASISFIENQTLPGLKVIKK